MIQDRPNIAQDRPKMVNNHEFSLTISRICNTQDGDAPARCSRDKKETTISFHQLFHEYAILRTGMHQQVVPETTKIKHHWFSRTISRLCNTQDEDAPTGCSRDKNKQSFVFINYFTNMQYSGRGCTSRLLPRQKKQSLVFTNYVANVQYSGRGCTSRLLPRQTKLTIVSEFLWSRKD